MNQDVASFLAHRLKRLGDAPPAEAAAAIREFLELERNSKLEKLDQDSDCAMQPPAILHHGRERLNVV